MHFIIAICVGFVATLALAYLNQKDEIIHALASAPQSSFFLPCLLLASGTLGWVCMTEWRRTKRRREGMASAQPIVE